MKIKKLKIKLNKDNEYSDYRYFIPKSNNIKMTDGRDVDEAVQSLKDKIANLKEQANYLIDKAPLVKYAEGTSITITDCAEAPLRKLTIEGNSKQETRSGKNLCKLADKTDTSNGITSVITDGVVSVNGTATSTWFNLTTNQSFKLNAGTYTVSVNKALTQFGIDFYDSSGTVFSLAKNLTSAKITLSSEKIITRLVGVVANGEVLNIDGLTFQIEEGSVATEYEQYGASPSIEHEAPIESVGDNINLFDGIFNKHDIANDTGIEQSFESANHLLTANYIEVKSNTDYTLSFDHIFSANTGITKIMEFDKDHNFITRNSASSKTNIITFKTSGNCHYIRVGIFDAGGISETKLKIEKGTKATPYSPYGQGSVEICKCNKNFFNKDNIREKHRLDAKGLDYYQVDYFVSDYIPVKEKTKYVKNTLISTMQAVSYYDKDKNHIKRNTTENPFTTPEGTCYIRTGDLLTNLDTLQVEEGSLSTEYAPHQSQTKALYTQQPFKAIGDVKDRFVKQDGVWYEEHKIFRKIFDGTENWLLGAPNYRYYIEINNKAEMSNIDITPLSSRFVCVSGTGIEIDYDTIWLQKLSDSSFRINIFNTNYLSDLANFKKWLTELYNAGTPVYVDYVLEIPTLIPCTAEQVEVLESLQSYDKITYYSVDKTNNVQANIKLIYKQDINAILEGEGV